MFLCSETSLTASQLPFTDTELYVSTRCGRGILSSLGTLSLSCVLFVAFHSTTDCFTSTALYLFLARHKQIKADSSQQFSGSLCLFLMDFLVVGWDMGCCIDSVIKPLDKLSALHFLWLYIPLKHICQKTKQKNHYDICDSKIQAEVVCAEKCFTKDLKK